MYLYNNYFHFYTTFILNFHYFRQRKGYKNETVIKIWMAVTVVKLGGKYYFKSLKSIWGPFLFSGNCGLVPPLHRFWWECEESRWLFGWRNVLPWWHSNTSNVFLVLHHHVRRLLHLRRNVQSSGRYYLLPSQDVEISQCCRGERE